MAPELTSVSLKQKLVFVENFARLPLVGEQLAPDVAQGLLAVISDFKANTSADTMLQYADAWMVRLSGDDNYISCLIAARDKLSTIRPFGDFYNRHINQLGGVDESDFIHALSNFDVFIDTLIFKYFVFQRQEEQRQDIHRDVRNMHRAILLNVGLEELESEVAKIAEAEVDCDEKQIRADELAHRLVDFLGSSGVVLVSGSITTSTDVDKWTSISADTIVKGILDRPRFGLKDGERVDEVQMLNCRELFMAIRRLYSDIDFAKNVGALDQDQLAIDTATFGAKCANLNAISEIDGANIPDYTGMPAAIYEKWKDGQGIDEDLAPFFGWVSGRKVILRSSAVYAEDGEELTGAGRYDSVPLPEEATYGEFKAAAIQIFESVDSEAAVEYRRSRGVEKESMGVVVQEFVKSPQGGQGQIDTALRGVPGLVRILFNDGFEVILNKAVLEEMVLSEETPIMRPEIFHYQLDQKRVDISSIIRVISRMMKLVVVLGKLHGRPIQIEFGTGKTGRDFYVFQTRPLPTVYSQEAEMEFPDDQEPILKGRAMGVGDFELDLLPDDDVGNRRKTGAVVFVSGVKTSITHPERFFPKSGAVLLLKTERFEEHLEVICAERGILMIVCDYDQITPIMRKLEKLKKVRVVANGLEGRVYPVKSSNVVAATRAF